MISASHNPFQDNGIKFFMAGGKKLSDEVEEKLEALLKIRTFRCIGGVELGELSHRWWFPDYERHLIALAEPWHSRWIKVVIDCANGAASALGASLFSNPRVTLFEEPDGRNINDGCGSTHPEVLQAKVVEEGADVGFAFDGDADRVLAVDHTGALVDGDHILAILAIDAKANGTLKDDTLVITVMANLGLKLAMEAAGIKVYETKVGDRYVLEALDANGWSMGGEQSGHIIVPEFGTTGDGMATALQLMAVMKRTGKSLHELASVVTKLPQVLRNVRVKNKRRSTEQRQFGMRLSWPVKN